MSLGGRIRKEGPMVAHVLTVGGNWFEVAKQLNSLGLAQYLVSVTSINGYNSLAMLCLPATLLHKLQEEKRIF